MKFKKILCLLFVINMMTACIAITKPTAKFTIKVIDENKQPIQNIKVTMYPIRINKTYEAITDKNGICIIQGSSDFMCSFRIEENDYYISTQRFEFRNSNKILNRWEPWNQEITIKLRKKQNPIAMNAKNYHTLKIPQVDSVGYDLEKGDWVTPHGKGIISDFIFKKTYYKSYNEIGNDFTLKYDIIFSNENDGIREYNDKENIQSFYKWPYKASETEYKNKILKCFSNHNEDLKQNNRNPNAKYIFRVRTKIDKDGNIISAKYGKIKGDFLLSTFTYYYNPDGTRNLEFDPEKNLFKFNSEKETFKVDKYNLFQP